MTSYEQKTEKTNRKAKIGKFVNESNEAIGRLDDSKSSLLDLIKNETAVSDFTKYKKVAKFCLISAAAAELAILTYDSSIEPLSMIYLVPFALLIIISFIAFFICDEILKVIVKEEDDEND